MENEEGKNEKTVETVLKETIEEFKAFKKQAEKEKEELKLERSFLKVKFYLKMFNKIRKRMMNVKNAVRRFQVHS